MAWQGKQLSKVLENLAISQALDDKNPGNWPRRNRIEFESIFFATEIFFAQPKQDQERQGGIGVALHSFQMLQLR
eukprot:691560-Amphidinium_carterae.1